MFNWLRVKYLDTLQQKTTQFLVRNNCSTKIAKNQTSVTVFTLHLCQRLLTHVSLILDAGIGESSEDRIPTWVGGSREGCEATIPSMRDRRKYT